jgi:cytochrome c oxidase cbb3-type subunit 3
MMPAQDGVLTAIEIDTLAKAIVASNPTSTPLFAQKGCTACHGADGKGIQAMGSANLTDKIWRFDGSLKGVTQTITHGVNAPGDTKTRVAVMPSFKTDNKIDSDTMAKLAVYVYKFGGGQPDPSIIPVLGGKPKVEAVPADNIAPKADAPVAAETAKDKAAK